MSIIEIKSIAGTVCYSVGATSRHHVRVWRCLRKNMNGVRQFHYV